MCLAEDAGDGLEAGALGLVGGHEDEGGGTVGELGGVGGGDRASVALEGGGEGANLVGLEVLELLVVGNNGVALLGGNGDGGDLGPEPAVLQSGARRSLQEIFGRTWT